MIASVRAYLLTENTDPVSSELLTTNAPVVDAKLEAL